ncbi:uncharacterized protein (TIGR00369 family) [Bradyrhizobium diazoefficiens]
MENPDIARITEFIRKGGKTAPFDSNPLARALHGQIIDVDAKGGTLAIDYEPGDDFVQGNGVLAGGAVASMLDFALGLCAMPMLPEGSTTATASLTISYLRAAKPGRFVARASVEKLGKRNAFTRAVLTDKQGDAIASGVSVLAIIPSRLGGPPTGRAGTASQDVEPQR